MGSVHHRALPESETLTNLVTSGTENRLLADSKPDVYFNKPLGCFQAGFKQEVCTWKKSLQSETYRLLFPAFFIQLRIV
jgi:hypothetical protein